MLISAMTDFTVVCNDRFAALGGLRGPPGPPPVPRGAENSTPDHRNFVHF